MTKMRAMVVPKAGAKLMAEERDLPTPATHEVRIRVHACGVCHSDSITFEGHMPGIGYPRVPGHEVIGTIDAVGPDVGAGPSARAWGSAGFQGRAAIAASAGAAMPLRARMCMARPA